MTRRGWILTVGGVALIVAFFATQVKVSVPSRPKGTIDELASLRERGDLNVVFIVIDTLRADRLSAYGYNRDTSPTLKELAQSGVRFARVESQSSWTKASMASLWTGLFPHRTGVVRFQHGLPDAAVLPAEVFRDNGYLTAGIFRNGWIGPNFGFGQGFDLYITPTQRSDPAGFQRPTPGMQKLPGSDQDITLAALEFLNQNQSRKFLLYLHYMDVHQYAYDEEAASQGFGSSISDYYDSSVRWVDSNLLALFAGLDDLDLLKKTIVVVASDHGEAFREHGNEGHAQNLYQEAIHVPLLVLLPFRLDEELVVDPVVRNVDVWPTVLDLAGLPPLPQTDGVSLVPLMVAAGKGEATPEVPHSVSYLDQTWGLPEAEAAPLVSIREADQRVLYRPKKGEIAEIYDLSVDPGERRNLKASPPEWAAPLQEELQSQLEQPVPWGEASEVEVSDLERGQLRALGYLLPPGPPK
jgi:arylsulfatase A-like enzyme